MRPLGWPKSPNLHRFSHCPLPSYLAHTALRGEGWGGTAEQSQRNLGDVFFTLTHSKRACTYFPVCNDQVILQILNVYIFWCDCTHGHELEQTLGDNGGQRSLVCCSPWIRRVGHALQRNNNKFTVNVSVCAAINRQAFASFLKAS